MIMNTLAGTSSKKCDICRGKSTENAELYLGPLLEKGNVAVHYHCLLLSTHLAQEGEDNGGIYGFLLRHIRCEIAAAAKRLCEYCGEIGASIQCNKCKIYFHLRCGIRNQCLYEFEGEFISYCHKCIKLNKFQKLAKKTWKRQPCYICKESLGYVYSPTEFLYGPCCNNGFVHRNCLQTYALASGYYMRCIWCRKPDFRKSVRLQGIFVPDREAKWETKSRFMDFHRGHSHCDVEYCKCAKGREYKSSRWQLINCNLCGSFGAHYPDCVAKLKNGKLPSITEYKCETCANIERDNLDTTLKSTVNECPVRHGNLYVKKSSPSTNQVSESSFSSLDKNPFSMQAGHQQRNTFFNTDSTENTVTSTTSDNIANDANTTEDVPMSTESFSSALNVISPAINDIIDLTMTEHESDCEELEIFDFSEDKELIGTCKLRINKNSPRFAGKSLTDVLESPDILRESDVIEKTGDIIPFEKVKFLLMGVAGDEFLAKNCPNLYEDNL